MMNIYPKNSIKIHCAANGFIVNVKGTREQQEDGLDGVYVFEGIGDLTSFIEDHYEEKKENDG